MERIPVTKEELSDFNSDYVSKIKGVALTRKEIVIVKKINEIVDYLNDQPLR